MKKICFLLFFLLESNIYAYVVTVINLTDDSYKVTVILLARNFDAAYGRSEEIKAPAKQVTDMEVPEKYLKIPFSGTETPGHDANLDVMITVSSEKHPVQVYKKGSILQGENIVERVIEDRTTYQDAPPLKGIAPPNIQITVTRNEGLIVDFKH